MFYDKAMERRGNVCFLKNTKKEHVRLTKHARNMLDRENNPDKRIPWNVIVDLIVKQKPINIEKQDNKKFGLTYPYPLKDNYDIYIVILIKDKFINVATEFITNKKKEKKLMKKMNHSYDYESDILSFFLAENFDYEFSQFINKAIVINYNQNNKPIGFEFLNASKSFKTKKIFLKNIDFGEIELIISEKKVTLNIKLIIKVHNKPTPLPLNISGVNENQIPNIETKVAITST